MSYDCIPIWLKKREVDEFNYPLRSKKEILLENEINPPRFNVEIKKRMYVESQLMHGASASKADTRNTRVTFAVDMDSMTLTPLQKKRMIFLLGRRYRNDNKLRITVRQYNNLNYNYARGVDTIKQLYFEAKRAPLFLWDRMYSKERRYFKKLLFGKTQEEQEKAIERVKQQYTEAEGKFEELWKDQSNFTEAKMLERYNKKLEENNNNRTEKDGKTSTSSELDGLIPKDEYYKKLVNERVLSPKAYKTFFENQLDNNGK
jgi:hypothetical protein